MFIFHLLVLHLPASMTVAPPVDYALFIALIAAAVFGAALALGQSVLGLFIAPITAGF
jgi:hypothetical protein